MIHFDQERLENVKLAHEKWWRGELERPLMCVTVTDAHAGRESKAPLLDQATCTLLQWSAEAVIDALDAQLGKYEFLGDAFPVVSLDSFGPGVLAALCGAKLDNSSGGVWFWPDEERDIADIHVQYDPNNVWAQRIKSLYRAGRERWGNLVTMSMPDLGGVMDVVATLRGTENLLYDLYDDPDEVKRVVKETESAWYAAYDDFRAAMGEDMGYTDWLGALSATPSYVLQCDFCYMIGNPMFREFVLDTLKQDTERLHHTIYHLDGVGELNHLDDLLALDKLDAIQWVFGAGKPGPMHWLDVYRRIAAAGKRMVIEGSPQEFLDALDVLHGSPYARHWLPQKEAELAQKLLLAR